MKNRLVLVLSLCGLIAGGAYLMIGRGSENENFKNSSQTGKVIIAFGDALSEEQGVQTFPSHLPKLTGLEVKDLTRAGETSKVALERVESVVALKPNYVLVTLGYADLESQIELKETLDNLEKIFTALQRGGAAVVYLAVIPPLVGDNWAMAIKDVVKSHGVLWVDDIMMDVWSNPDLMSDSFLPNEKGHEVIAARLKNVLNF